LYSKEVELCFITNKEYKRGLWLITHFTQLVISHFTETETEESIFLKNKLMYEINIVIE